MSTTDAIACHHGLGPAHPWEPDRYCPPEPVAPAPDTERDERLRDIQERAAAATEGPWEADHIDPSVWSPQIIVLGNYTAADGYDSPAWHDGTTTDRDFIAAARTDVPWLLAEVTRLDAVVTAVRGLREEYFDEDGHTEPEDVWRLHRDLGRALDGGAA